MELKAEVSAAREARECGIQDLVKAETLLNDAKTQTESQVVEVKAELSATCEARDTAIQDLREPSRAGGCCAGAYRQPVQDAVRLAGEHAAQATARRQGPADAREARRGCQDGPAAGAQA